MRCLVPISNFPEKEGEQEKKNTKMKSIFCNGINKIITTINNDNNDDDDIASIRIGGKISRFYKKVFLLPEMNGEVTERRATATGFSRAIQILILNEKLFISNI